VVRQVEATKPVRSQMQLVLHGTLSGPVSVAGVAQPHLRVRVFPRVQGITDQSFVQIGAVIRTSLRIHSYPVKP
jgi:hypothetical protein